VQPVMLASLVSMSFMIFGFYSWQRYFLDLLGRNLVWVDGVISALVGLSLIVGNACVAPLSRVVRTRTGLLMLSTGAQAVLAVACGLLTNFFAVVSLYLLYGVAVGLAMPVKQAYLTPTSRRPRGRRSSRSTRCSRAAAGCSGRRRGAGSRGRARSVRRGRTAG